MKKILMSIKKEFAEKILNGTKRYEYRKIVAREYIDKIFIYVTSPISMVVAVAEVKGIISDTPSKLWEKTKNYSGVSKEFFEKYFASKTKAYAYELGAIQKFEKPKSLDDFKIKSPPQSFVYVDEY